MSNTAHLKSLVKKNEKFENKLRDLFSLHIPLLDDLSKAEKSDKSPLQKGTLENFLKELDEIVRWTKQNFYLATSQESYIRIPQKGRISNLHETDLDHVIAMERLSQQIFNTNKYPDLKKLLNQAKVKNGILVHDGGEINGVGDVTHADEEQWKTTRMERKAKEHLTFTTFFRKHSLFRNLGEKLERDLYQSYFGEEFELNLEGCFVVFFDRLQAVQFAFENIYPYEDIYRDSRILQYYLREYILRPTVELLKQLQSKKAREELSQFITSILSLKYIGDSYKKAIATKRINRKEATALISTVEKTLHDLYNNDVDVFLSAWNLAEDNSSSST